METIRILQEQYEKESKKANIPVPPIMTVEDYDRLVAKDFVRPVQYQKYKSKSACILPFVQCGSSLIHRHLSTHIVEFKQYFFIPIYLHILWNLSSISSYVNAYHRTAAATDGSI